MPLTQVKGSVIDRGVYVTDYGAVGDGVTDDTAAIQAALDSGSADVVLPAGTYIVSALAMTTGSQRLSGLGTLKASSAVGALDLLTVTGAGCEVSGITIDMSNTDNSFASGFVADRNGVVVMGASNASYRTGFVSHDLTVRNCGEAGVIVQYMNEVYFYNPRLSRMGEYGFFCLSVTDMSIYSPRIDDVYPGNSGVSPYLNAYGITYTRSGSDNVSTDCAVFDGFVSDVTSWEAYDTHHGLRIRFVNCSSLNCHNGVVVASNSSVGAESHDVQITGGSHSSYGQSFSRSGQTYEPGAAVTANMGTSTNNGEGLVISSVLSSGHGSGRNSSDGAMQVQYADGFTISGCTLRASLKRGIALIGECVNANVHGNLIKDVVAVGGISAGIEMSSIGDDSGNIRDNVISGTTTYSVANTEVTVASGAITVAMGHHTVDTEADAASDDLTTINGGYDGRVLMLNAESSTRTVVLKDNSGNMLLNGDFSLDSMHDSITLMWDDAISHWLEISRSDNST